MISSVFIKEKKSETVQLFYCFWGFLSSSGFVLPDLPEQFGPPDTAPPFLNRLMEAVETKGNADLNKVTGHSNACEVLLMCENGLDE